MHRTMKKKKQVVVAVMEIGLAVNGAKKKYCLALWLVARLQHRISVANKSVETIAKFVYLGVRTQNCMHEEIKNTCPHWAQNLMSYCFVHKTYNHVLFM